MANMLKMPALKFSTPIVMLISLKAYDSTFHRVNFNSTLSSDHDEQHLEPAGRFDCMRAICRQGDGLALI